MTDITANRTTRDIKTISMVSTVHGMSHFYQLTLPPLLPVLKVAFGVSYTDLGLMMSVFYICSAVSQTPAGFLVDRLGARAVLMTGLATYGIGIALVGTMPQFWMLLPCAGLAGIGNSVFHPADYSVLTANVTPGRMARAYSAHALSGNIGWVLAPMTVLGLTGVIGWQHALQVVGPVWRRPGGLAGAVRRAARREHGTGAARARRHHAGAGAADRADPDVLRLFYRGVGGRHRDSDFPAGDAA